jgi:hypothetical protein
LSITLILFVLQSSVLLQLLANDILNMIVRVLCLIVIQFACCIELTESVTDLTFSTFFDSLSSTNEDGQTITAKNIVYFYSPWYRSYVSNIITKSRTVLSTCSVVPFLKRLLLVYFLTLTL